MAPCSFCPRYSTGNYALTRLKGNPERLASWERVIEPVCPRCWRLLDRAEGRVLKATGERWFLGHGVGLFEAKGIRRD